MIYECHITLDLEDAAKLPPNFFTFCETEKWKSSEIHRDITMGEKSYYYLTTHDRDLLRMHARMKAMADACRYFECEVIREKIELIIYDTKLKT